MTTIYTDNSWNYTDNDLTLGFEIEPIIKDDEKGFRTYLTLNEERTEYHLSDMKSLEQAKDRMGRCTHWTKLRLLVDMLNHLGYSLPN